MAIAGITDNNSLFYTQSSTNNITSRKSNEADFQSKIEKKRQVFPEGDMVIPQPPRPSNFRYDNSISNKSKEDMTLDEYKQWVANEMSQMSVSGWYQSTCVGGSLTITEECFERMKTDPEWENTVLGMVREMYSVNGIMGSKMIGFQVIGASEAECYGEGIPVDSNSGMGSSDDGESWWEKRHKAMEELLKEQAAKTQEKAVAKRKAQQEQWLQEQVESNNRMQQYFAERVSSGQNISNATASIASQAVSTGIGAYETTIDTFSADIVGGKL